jgi:transcriptional regulator with XRE-family HTH domain
MSKLTDTLRALRESQGMTLRELAPKVGVSHQTLGHYETGTVDPPASRLEAWAAALGASVVVERPMASESQTRAAKTIAEVLPELDATHADALERVARSFGHELSRR